MVATEILVIAITTTTQISLIAILATTETSLDRNHSCNRSHNLVTCVVATRYPTVAAANNSI